MTQAGFRFILHADDLEQVANQLAGFDDLNITAPGDAVIDPHWQDLVGRLRAQQQHLRRLLDELGIEPEPATRGQRNLPGTDLGSSEQELERADADISSWQKRRREAEEEHASLVTLSVELAQLSTLGVAVGELQTLRYLAVDIGWIPASDAERMSLPMRATPLLFMSGLRDGDRLLFVAATTPRHRSLLRQMLATLQYEPLHSLTAPVEQNAAAEVGRRLAGSEQRRHDLDREGSELARRWGSSLLTLSVRLDRHLRIARMLERHVARGAFAMLAGTVADRRAGELLTAVDRSASRPHALYLVAEVA